MADIDWNKLRRMVTSRLKSRGGTLQCTQNEISLAGTYRIRIVAAVSLIDAYSGMWQDFAYPGYLPIP